MARRGKRSGPSDKTAKPPKPPKNNGDAAARHGLPEAYWKACRLAQGGSYKEARTAYLRLERGSARKPNPRLRALIQNDLAVLAAMEGQLDEACATWRAVLDGGNDCLTARLNLGLVEAELGRSAASNLDAGANGAGPVVPGLEARPTGVSAPPELIDSKLPGRVRVAVVSLLFNWPSTGGGNMHTAGLVDFLGRDGYEVRHFFASYPAWAIGRVANNELPASTAIEFAENEWNVATIRDRFRRAVDSFAPDYVVISDTWNMKPHLAEAMRGYPTILLMQAQECLCPLNNLRLIGIGPVQVEQCPRNQLATPQVVPPVPGRARADAPAPPSARTSPGRGWHGRI